MCLAAASRLVAVSLRMVGGDVISAVVCPAASPHGGACDCLTDWPAISYTWDTLAMETMQIHIIYL